MPEYYFLKNKARFLSFIKKITVYSFGIIIISLVFNSCFSQDALGEKVVNTRKEISGGLQKGNTIYFLCDYVLSKPGTTIIPMYMYVPGTIYYDQVFLYAFDISMERLTRIAGLKPTSSYAGRGSVRNAKWAYADSKIYVTYSTGWNKVTKEYIKDIFSLDIKTHTVNELKDDDKEKVLNTRFSSGKTKGVIPMTQVMYHAGCVPDEEWQLPSPLDYSKMNRRELEKVIIEQVGDIAFKDAVFRSISGSISKKDVNRIILSMRKWSEKLPNYKQMMSIPYMEKWSVRLSMTARLNNKDAQDRDASANSADLLEAAYTDNVTRLTELLKNTDINTADENGCTALMYAIFGKAPHTMEILIRNGADLKREAKSGYNAWMFVANTGLRRRYLAFTQK